MGSSPHTRDKSRAGSSLRKAGRIIPAYAGQMKDTTYDKFSVRDHPRIRGTNISKQLCNIAFWGSSPHTRDKFDHMDKYNAVVWDHPRIRGTNFTFASGYSFAAGSSPHTRDKSFSCTNTLRGFRIIPAYAGQITE